MFAKAARPPPSLGEVAAFQAPLLCLALLAGAAFAVCSGEQGAFDSGGAVRPDFDLSQIRSSHTPERTFYILKALSRLSLWLTCGAALLPVAHPSSKTGPWAACPG